MKTKCCSPRIPWRSCSEFTVLVSGWVPHSCGCWVLKSQRTCGKSCRVQLEEQWSTHKEGRRGKSLRRKQTSTPWVLTDNMKRMPSLALKLLEIDISSCSEKAVQWPSLKQRKYEERKQVSFQYIALFYVFVEPLYVTVFLLSICSD